jgi:hypothetical protein
VAVPVTECTLDVKASSEGAKVVVNGEARGVAPQTIAMPCGANATVEIRHPRYAAFARDVVVDAPGTVIDAKLEREKTQLTVVSEPPGAEVRMGGVVLRTTPLVTQVNRFEVGRLEFRADGYVGDWRQVVPKDAKKTVSITLKRSR